MRKVSFTIESWPFIEPFSITGHTFTASNILLVKITEENQYGKGEGSGVFYAGETAESMLIQANNIKSKIENGCSRAELLNLLPAGGARNAIDCALWDLETKSLGKTIWERTGVTPKKIETVFTIGIDTPEKMALKAKSLQTKYIKVKLNADKPLERIKAVIKARPDAKIVVDVNQGWTFNQLTELAPIFKKLGVLMIEQPLPRGKDNQLENYISPIPLCADESCLDSSELEYAAKRYQMINIKLDKTGGLTEALSLAQKAKDKKLGLMVGNFQGTSLGMAPAFVIAQMCDFIDLDGPIFLQKDRAYGLKYDYGVVSGLTSNLWA